jgi:protein-S-isoprenylcysteine O-methyltransferase Ste14
MTTAHDPIAQFVFYSVIACWLVFLVTFGFRSRRPRTRETKRDRTALLGMSFQFASYLAIWLPQLQRERFSPIIVEMPKAVELAVAVATVAMAGGSVWLVDVASRRLGKQWGLAARLVEGHDLIKDGPYGWVRNPIYAGMLGLLVATGMAVSQWIVLILATLVFVIGTAIRIRSEERLLREAFGARFEEYTRKVAALIPGVY